MTNQILKLMFDGDGRDRCSHWCTNKSLAKSQRRSSIAGRALTVMPQSKLAQTGVHVFLFVTMATLFRMRICLLKTGHYALLIARASTERVNPDGSITGRPCLYGYMMAPGGKTVRFDYLQGQNMSLLDEEG
jgi:hypothetical protein